MKYANIDELLDIINDYEVVTQDLPIRDGKYICGQVYPTDKRIVLNSHNTPKTNVDTVSHEVTHVYYDWIKKYNLPEEQIEDISQRQLAMVKEYHDAVKVKAYHK